ncbi:MAG: class I SAM-dependent methyltransferase [Chloroflexi bacterium]|nr:class I SAM-dependent methyltransferase [Chloroflexota bacterium]
MTISRTKQNAEEEIICPICSSKGKVVYNWYEFHVVYCDVCGTQSVTNLPTSDELNDYYQQTSRDNNPDRWELHKNLVKSAFKHLLRNYQNFTNQTKPSSFLDIGGGLGYYAQAASAQGIETCLMDWGDFGLEFAREKLGISWIIKGNIQKCAEFFEADTFDFVLARHVIEHLLDPQEFLVNIAEIMKPDGILVLETPNVASKEQFSHPRIIEINYRILQKYNPELSNSYLAKFAMMKSLSGVIPPKHLWGFTDNGLVKILEGAGFEILKIRKTQAGHQVYDPLYYDYYRLATRKRLGIPYYFWERVTSIFFRKNGTSLAIFARRKK